MADLLTIEEERTLIAAAQKGDIDARNQLILKNQGLCRRAADRSMRPNWMDRDDLILEGNLGLVKAIERFDSNMGCRFSTYASRWVGQAIQRCVENTFYDLYVSSYAFNQVGQLQRRREVLLSDLDRDPTPQELSDDTSIPEEQVRALLQLCVRSTSLDAPVDGEEELSLLDIIQDDYRFEDRVDTVVWIPQCLALLPPKLRDVVEQRFGLAGQPPLTLKEIAKTMKVSRERVRQWEQKALGIIKSALEQDPAAEPANSMGS